MAGGSSKALPRRGASARPGDRVTRTSAPNPANSGSSPATSLSPPPEKSSKGRQSHKTPPPESASGSPWPSPTPGGPDLGDSGSVCHTEGNSTVSSSANNSTPSSPHNGPAKAQPAAKAAARRIPGALSPTGIVEDLADVAQAPGDMPKISEEASAESAPCAPHLSDEGDDKPDCDDNPSAPRKENRRSRRQQDKDAPGDDGGMAQLIAGLIPTRLDQLCAHGVYKPWFHSKFYRAVPIPRRQRANDLKLIQMKEKELGIDVVVKPRPVRERRRKMQEGEDSTEEEEAEDTWVGCDSCGKWRKVPSFVKIDVSRRFTCGMLPGVSCRTAEEEWDDDEWEEEDKPSSAPSGKAAGGDSAARGKKRPAPTIAVDPPASPAKKSRGGGGGSVTLSRSGSPRNDRDRDSYPSASPVSTPGGGGGGGRGAVDEQARGSHQGAAERKEGDALRVPDQAGAAHGPDKVQREPGDSGREHEGVPQQDYPGEPLQLDCQPGKGRLRPQGVGRGGGRRRGHGGGGRGRRVQGVAGPPLGGHPQLERLSAPLRGEGPLS